MDQPPLSILVTGASGFIGQHTVRHLTKLGHKVTALDYRSAQRHADHHRAMIVPVERDLAGERAYADRLCVIGSFPRSGSHWTRRMLAEMVARRNGMESGAAFGPALNQVAGFTQPFERGFWREFKGPIFVAAHNLRVNAG